MQREALKNVLIVSCQPVPGGPMDNPEMVVGFALAALSSGAGALRIESLPYLRAVRAATSAPIVGIIKRDLSDSPVRITPYVEDAIALAEAGADIVAFDATDRTRPASVAELIAAVKAKGKLTMADCSSLQDAQRALAAGIDFVGTTLSGYVGEAEPVDPDLGLIADMVRLTPFVIAEGRIRSTDQASAAARAGAYAVVVGSAITRTEHATSWFKEAVEHGFADRQPSSKPVLAIDIGGTKIIAALVENGTVRDEVTLSTQRDAGPDRWIDDLAKKSAAWRGQVERVSIAVTGIIDNDLWSALNPATLTIPEAYPLVDRLRQAFDLPVFAANDAQAAAWGEHRFGAGQGQDIAFLTISTGIGGGLVLNGKPLLGIAGHFGLLQSPSAGAGPLEDQVSGRWIADQASRAGHQVDAPAVFAAARQGATWANSIIDQSAGRVALLCRDIQLMFDPDRIVIGGGIGLADGYLDRVIDKIPAEPVRLKPRIVASRLGRHAGVIGVADLAFRSKGTDWTAEGLPGAEYRDKGK
ncbi:putative N-acetylmannosamine-6-phosphate 2-epimerase (plasmid) [Devosia neptuniae]|uniref:Putative N-acetylmannosamine-6-phosphate 2-epimerase n=1 Tax=Devosia neptuniae TaxID=191302 RepID=A0ABY6C6R4_9HYPH|nr:putative N-acetylmannosamine-6-phosphate 2-epimerase [Devosia neptuniae]UXN67810.1 putative N-acetylmannosamine-6-phosphate 2-epimerase [Devosia neptuniae]